MGKKKCKSWENCKKSEVDIKPVRGKHLSTYVNFFSPPYINLLIKIIISFVVNFSSRIFIKTRKNKQKKESKYGCQIFVNIFISLSFKCIFFNKPDFCYALGGKVLKHILYIRLLKFMNVFFLADIMFEKMILCFLLLHFTHATSVDDKRAKTE